MGCCLTNHNQHDAIIQNIIEQTVLEQEQLQYEEGNQDRIKTTLNSDQELLNSDDSKKQKKYKSEHNNENIHHKRGIEKEDEHNYLIKIEYNVKIKSIIVELIRLENTQYYKIQFSASYLDYEVLVDLKGIQVNENHSHLQIFPLTYQEASKYARYDCFFKNDKYFNYDKRDSKNQQVFEKLLLVERQVPKNHQKSASSQERRVVSRRWALVADMTSVLSKFQFNKFSNIAAAQNDYNVVNELMEVVEIFDIEVNPRFLNILFHLMMQHYYPVLRENLVFIEEAYFLFQNLPHLDCPQYYRILLFYQGMNYSLKDLHTYLEVQQMALSELCLLKLAVSLMKIFFNCYSRYLYRLNFVPSNIFYLRRLKSFKLQPFQRISSLVPFQPDVQQSLDCVSDSKMDFYKKSYVKDYLAICDLIILFKSPCGFNQKILSKMRRKKKDEIEDEIQFKEYLLHAESIFDEIRDKGLLEFIRQGCNRSFEGTDFDLDHALDEFQSNISQFESQITQIEYQLKRKQRNQRSNEYPNLDKINQVDSDDDEDDDDDDEEVIYHKRNKAQSPIQDQSEDQENLLNTFDIELDIEQLISKNEKVSKDKDKEKIERKIIKNEMIYSSLLRNKYFFKNCQMYLFKDMTYSIDRVQGLIYYAQARESETLDLKEREKQFQHDLDIAIQVIQKEQDNSIKTAHFLVLVQLLQYSPKKSQAIILRLLQLCQLQQKYKYERRHVIKKLLHSHQGTIEIRKQIILQLANVDHLMQSQRLNDAYNAISKTVEVQMKANASRTLLFGYSLFVNGLICQEIIMIQSAMITFSMSRQIYDQFFPMEKMIEIYEEKKGEKQPMHKKELFKLKFKKDEPEIITKKVLVNFQNMATYNLSKLSYNLGIVFCQSNDADNALRALYKAIEYRKVIYDEFADEIIEIVLQIFKIFIENEESSSVHKMAWMYARKINELFRQNKLHYLNQKKFAQLLFLLAGIFQSCNSYFSALRFYNRANKAYATSKTQTFNRAYFVQQQRKLILTLIKEYDIEKMKLESPEMFFSVQVRSIYDKMKPFFQQVYFIQSVQFMDNTLNYCIGAKLLYANGYLKNKDHQLAQEQYQEIHKLYSAIQKDECYGHNIEKIGEIYIEAQEFSKAIQQFKYAIGIYEKFLFFPHKEYCLMRCHLQIIAILAMQKQTEELIKYFHFVETFIFDCQQFMKWSILAEERKHNKFQLISKKVGVKILYQLVELVDLIDKFRNVRKRWFKRIHESDYIAERGQKMQKRLKNHRQENRLLADYRKQCLLGKNVNIKFRKYENQIALSSNYLPSSQQAENKNQSDDSIKNEQDNFPSQKTIEPKAESPKKGKWTKAKFFLLDIQKKMKRSTKKMNQANNNQVQQEIQKEEKSQINSLKNIDQISSTIETQRTQLPVTSQVLKKSTSQQKSKINIASPPQKETKSKRAISEQKKGKLNPFQKVSKKQI